MDFRDEVKKLIDEANKPSEPKTPIEPSADIRTTARTAAELLQGYVDAGFSRTEAMQFIIALSTASIKNSREDD